jgi:hypothetical protein
LGKKWHKLILGGSPERKQEIKQDIGVDSEALNECYGLPTVVGQSKDGCLQYITENSKASGWKGQGLSMKGKEILVKSVLQATPTYRMNCFRLNRSNARS